MKSLAVFAAAVAVLVVAGCSASPSGSDAMMSGKKKEGSCPFQSAVKKDSCCDSVATKDKKDSCCESGAEVKVKSGCCEGKSASEACADCKKACEETPKP